MRESKKPTQRRHVGRPPTGNKGYLIRMTPAANAVLRKMAKAAGYSHMGDWLNGLAETSVPVKKISQAELKNFLLLAAFRAAKSLHG
jgi:hypothetical protein